MQDQQKMNPDAVAASLALATHISQQSMPKAPQEAPQESQEPMQEGQETPGQAEPQDDSAAKIAELESKITEMEKSTKDTIRAEISGIKDMIKQMLENEEE